MTNKPMLSVERELIQRIADHCKFWVNHPYLEAIADVGVELRALLDKPAYPDRLCHTDKGAHPYICGCFKGDDEAQRRFDEHHSKAAQHQGEPAAKAKPVAKLHAERLTGRDGEYGVTVEDSGWFNTCRLTGGIFNLYAEQPAPVAMALPFAEKVIAKLQRFEACASDGQDVDIGRHWFDLLTQLELLRRVQRSPAYWEMTQQGEDALKATRLNSPQ